MFSDYLNNFLEVPTVFDICSNRLIKAVCEVGVWLDVVNVPVYSGKYSKQVYTQHQLLQCLVVKTVYRLKYRELAELLQVSDTLRDCIGLEKVPHFTTFQKFAARFPCRILHQIITSISKYLRSGTLSIALDSTGFSLDTSSYHYSRRIRRLERHRSYVKTTMAVDTETQAVTAIKTRLKRRHDIVDAKPTLNKSRLVGKIKNVVADRGYDSEDLMTFIKDTLKAEPIIDLKYMDKPLSKTGGSNRKQLKKDFPLKTYHQRSKVETVNSTIKRKFGSTIHARNGKTQKQETHLKALIHNLTLNKIVKILKDFYKAV